MDLIGHAMKDDWKDEIGIVDRVDGTMDKRLVQIQG
jgi:hypothetical protein